MAEASTSLGEASARIQATDLERRKTPRVRTAPPGLRVEPKWLPGSPDTPFSAKALTRGVLARLFRLAIILSSVIPAATFVFRPQGGEAASHPADHSHRKYSSSIDVSRRSGPGSDPANTT